MKRAGKILIPLVVLLFALYWMPFITVNINEGGAEYRVPFASCLESAGDGRVTFTSLRSAYALEKDAANAMMAYGDHADFEKAIAVLDEVKESIINAYAEKTGLSRNKISKLMDEETWMNARKALELGFANSILGRVSDDSGYMVVDPLPRNSIMFSRKWEDKDFLKKLQDSIPEPKTEPFPETPGDEEYEKSEETFEDLEITPDGRPVSEIMERLSIIKNYI